MACCPHTKLVRRQPETSLVVPAEAGTQSCLSHGVSVRGTVDWIPASAGTTGSDAAARVDRGMAVRDGAAFCADDGL